MSAFQRIDRIIRQKRYEGECAIQRERMISEANIETLRKTRAEIEAKMKGH